MKKHRAGSGNGSYRSAGTCFRGPCPLLKIDVDRPTGLVAAKQTAASPWRVEMIVQAGKKVIVFPDHLSAEEVEREMRSLSESDWDARAETGCWPRSAASCANSNRATK
jgi:hypothetical protein